jgi:hypothetical protein
MAGARNASPAVRRSGMKGYRVYYINSANHVVDALDLACQDETTAVYKANRLGAGRALELWESDRLIVRFPTVGVSAPPP